MLVHSYFELTTTAIGWYIANKVAEFLVESGLIFLPILVVLCKNWFEPMRSQEGKAARIVSLRRMEQDVILALLVIVIGFLPAIPLAPADIQYVDTSTNNIVSADDKNSPYLQFYTPNREIQIPIAWWLVYEVSSLGTNAVIEFIDNLSHPSILRSLLRRVGKVRIENQVVIHEIRLFRHDCYEPSLAKFQKSENQPASSSLVEDVDWLGSRIFLTTPGFYKRCLDIDNCGTGYYAKTTMSQWLKASEQESYGPGQPFCDVWWAHETLGLRKKILDELHQAAPWFSDDVDRIKSKHDGKTDSLQRAMHHEDSFLRRFISHPPKPASQRADDNQTFTFWSPKILSFDGIQQILGSIGALIASAILHISMELIVIGLPMLQALILMMLYVSIPFVVPYAIVNPSIFLRIVISLFALRFVSAIWALAEFLDEKLIEVMYPDFSIFEHGYSGSAADIVLNLITLCSYITLPVAWFYLMGSMGSKVIGRLNQGWTPMSKNLESNSHSSTNRVTSMVPGKKN